jgi:hypothetical protein
MKSVVKIALGVLFVVLVASIIGGIVASGGGDTPSGKTTGTGTEGVNPPSSKKTEDMPSREAPGKTTYGDGTYLVGVEIDPGTYKTTGPDKDSVIPMCYWERAKNDSGELGSIIANHNSEGPDRVTVKAGETVKFSGDCKWTEVN